MKSALPLVTNNTAEWVRAFADKWSKWLLLLPLAFYFALPTYNFYWDGVAIAISIEKHLTAASLVYPSHLIYALFGGWLYRLSEAAGIHTRALFVMQAMNSLLAGLCVVLFYKCLRLRHVPANVSLPAALIFGFSATWWRFATDANAYVPAILFVLISDLLIERRPAAVAGMATAAAMLFHELAILFVPVALVRLRRRPREMLVYTATAILPVIGAYLWAYVSAVQRPALFGLLSWVTAHASDSGFSFHLFNDASYSIRGTFRLFFGGKLRDYVGDGVSQTALLTFALSVLGLVIAARQVQRRETAASPPPGHLYVWLFAYVAFLFFWMPQNTFYRLFYLPPLLAVLANAASNLSVSRAAIWCWVPIIFLWNFTFVIYPQSRPEFNVPLHFAISQRNTWPPGTPIVFRTFHPDLWTISYFNPQAAWIGQSQGGLEELDKNLSYAHSQKASLWLEATAYDFIAADPQGKSWLAAHEKPSEEVDFKDEKHEFRFHCLR